MSIDIEALKRACEGDPDAKIAVKRKWLQEVLRELTEREARRKAGDFITKMSEAFYGGGRAR